MIGSETMSMADPKRDPDLVDNLAEEFAGRLRAGERPSVEEYASRHPEIADELRTVLAGVALMEQLKPKRTDIRRTSPPRPEHDPLPSRVAEYRIVREIGRGGMGVVCEAYQETLGRRVAIKLLGSHLLADAKLRERFRRESRAAARLHHTNIVPVFAVGESNGQSYYVMQLIDGESLAEVIRRVAANRNPLLPPDNAEITRRIAPPQPAPAPTDLVRPKGTEVRLNRPPSTPVLESNAEDSSVTKTSDSSILSRTVEHSPGNSREFWHTVARIGASVADALAYSHGRGVLHRDIKPSNLLMDNRGTVWVTDFGVAKILEEANLTQSGEFAGTLKYMPPERFSGHSDARGDIYSLGVTLYELLTLRPAYPETSPQHLIMLIGQGAATPPRKLNADIPADLETVVLKSIARDPEQRYQTAADMAEDLRRFMEDRPVLAKRSGPIGRTWRWCRRNPALASAMALTFSLLVAITIISVVASARTKAASLEVAAAKQEIEKALASETAQRQHAESISNLALEALNQTYERFAPTRQVATAPTSNEDGIELPMQPALPPEAVRLLEDLLRTYERIARAGGEFRGLQSRAAEANFRIGDICQRLGRSDDAVRAYRAAIDLYSRSQKDQDTDVIRIKLARAYSELGQTLRSMQQFDPARLEYDRAIRTLTEAPAEFTNRPECRYELARSYYRLGQRDLFLSPRGLDRQRPPGEPGHGPGGFGHDHGPFSGPPPGPPPGSSGGPPPGRRPESFGDPRGRLAIAVLEPLVEEFPTVPEYRHLLACCYRDIPGERGEPGRPPQGANVDKAVELLRKLVADFPRVPDYLFDLCETLGRPNFPGRFRESDSGDKSNDRMREAISLSRELVDKYPNVPAYSFAHARYLNDLGIAGYRGGQYAEAEKLHRKALIIQSRMVRQYPDLPAYAVGLSMIEHSLGRDLAELGNRKEARTRLESAAARLEIVRKTDPSIGWARSLLGMIYRDLARILSLDGETELAAVTLRKSEEFANEFGRGPFGPPNRHGGPP
jgi:eukaryotic-like serine/threonine-protein kinase